MLLCKLRQGDSKFKASLGYSRVQGVPKQPYLKEK